MRFPYTSQPICRDTILQSLVLHRTRTVCFVADSEVVLQLPIDKHYLALQACIFFHGDLILWVFPWLHFNIRVYITLSRFRTLIHFPEIIFISFTLGAKFLQPIKHLCQKLPSRLLSILIYGRVLVAYRPTIVRWTYILILWLFLLYRFTPSWSRSLLSRFRHSIVFSKTLIAHKFQCFTIFLSMLFL